MAAGEPIVRALQLEQADGTPLSYADADAFLLAGWDLSFEDRGGTTLSPQPEWTIEDEGDGLHRLNIAAEPTGQWYAKITVPDGMYTPQLILAGDGDAYSVGGLAALMLAAVGSPSAGGSRTEGALDDWIEEDYFRADIVIPTAALAKIGAADLTGVTVTAAAKQPFPTKQSGDAQEIVFTPTVLDAANRIVKLESTWDAGYALTTVDRREYVLDVSVSMDGKQVTSNRYTFAIVWQADPR